MNFSFCCLFYFIIFKFITVNVNGLRNPNKRMPFLQWLSCLSADFVCLQEIHFSSCAEADSWFSSYGFLALTSPGSVHSCGSVVLYRPTFVLAKASFDRQGRFVLAHFKKNDCKIQVYLFANYSFFLCVLLLVYSYFRSFV